MSTIVHSYLRFPLKPPRHPLALAVEAHWRQQQGYQAPVVRQMRAMSLTMPSIVNHPNAIPWARGPLSPGGSQYAASRGQPGPFSTHSPRGSPAGVSLPPGDGN